MHPPQYLKTARPSTTMRKEAVKYCEMAVKYAPGTTETYGKVGHAYTYIHTL